MSEPTNERELSFAEKAVGLTFNPGGNEDVNKIKEAAAAFIDTFHPTETFPNGTEGEVIAMNKLALRAAQEAQMWAVKAATWGK